MNKVNKNALDFHSQNPKGKFFTCLPEKLRNIDQYKLSLAYSPGVAAPCQEIHKDPNKIYDYTSKGNTVAVVTNGTAVLGLGNLGAAASKPVMEGKAMLFKRFANIDALDIEIDETDPNSFIKIVKKISTGWGGINLEDIKAPECFLIEEGLKEILDIPVFHDDQHGTAIVTAAGLINACHIKERNLEELKVVINGAGAAAVGCINLIKVLGVKKENIITCDTKGVIYQGRTDRMNKWKEDLAVNTSCRTLEEAISDSDVFIGVSAKNVVSKKMIKSMAKNPIIFVMANPDPEILPEEIYEVRQDAIVATGRSDYKNQINNFLCFPYLFRGALDVQATIINNKIKIAAAYAIAEIARENITTEISSFLKGKGNNQFGPDYIVPTIFDSRLVTKVSLSVAKAAVESGVSKKKIQDFKLYEKFLLNNIVRRLDL